MVNECGSGEEVGRRGEGRAGDWRKEGLRKWKKVLQGDRRMKGGKGGGRGRDKRRGRKEDRRRKGQEK